MAVLKKTDGTIVYINEDGRHVVDEHLYNDPEGVDLDALISELSEGQVTELDLGRNYVNYDYLEDLVGPILQNANTLTILDMQDNDLDDNCAKMLIDILRGLPKITTFSCSASSMEGLGPKLFAKELCDNTDFLPNLSNLDLHGSGLGDDAAMAIYLALFTRPSLTVLNLTDNIIGPVGVGMLIIVREYLNIKIALDCDKKKFRLEYQEMEEAMDQSEDVWIKVVVGNLSALKLDEDNTDIELIGENNAE